MKRNRALMAVLIIVVILLATSTPVLALSWNESRSVENFFVDAKLLKGDGTGYGLDKTASRIEGTIILLRLMGKEAEAQSMMDEPCRFTDVPNWAKGYVNYAYKENISKGVSDTRFGIDEKMTAAQYNTLLLRVLGYNDQLGDFQWDDSVDMARKLSILPKDMAYSYRPSRVYTKGDLIDTSFCYLEAKFKDQDQTLLVKLEDTGVISGGLAEKYGLDIKGWDSIATGYSKDDYLKFEISGDELIVSGTSKDVNKSFILVQIFGVDEEVKRAQEVGTMDSSGQYKVKLSLDMLPDGEFYIDVYGNDEKYHEYISTVLSTVVLKKNDSDIQIKAAPVYGQNLRIHQGNQLIDLDYEMTPSTMSSTEYTSAITNLSKEITAGKSSNYEKAQAIHNWVAENIYYDEDYLEDKTETTNVNSIAVLTNKYAVCTGYANLTQDLLAAAGIPNRQVIGYVLGYSEKEDVWTEVDWKNVEPNHVWNEAYIDGRWIIIDATWDSSNRHKGTVFKEGDGHSDLYFDVSVQFLSYTHKIIIP